MVRAQPCETRGAAVVAAAGHDLGWNVGDLAGLVEHGQAGRRRLPDGDHAAVGEPAAIIEINMGVQQDAVPGLVGAGSGPTRPFQGRAGDDPLGHELGPDAVG
jgi:hypothetical protein